MLILYLQLYYNTDVCDLLPNPCENGGTCVNTGDDGHTCTCADGYTGHHCETPITPTEG